jgi:hypothetical protein
MYDLKYGIHSCVFLGISCRQRGARETVDVSRNTSGIVCWPMILTMTAKEFSWTGSFSHLAVYVAVHLHLETNDKK